MKFKKGKDQTWHSTLQFEFDDEAHLHHFLEACKAFQAARNALGKKCTLAQAVILVWNCTKDEKRKPN